jgi:ABC-type nickel/cobalt efflux system permease component RcnA
MGRPHLPHRRRSLGALLGAVAAVVLLPGSGVAHPLGNFTINHYAEVRIEPERVLLDVVIDQAEIPAFQARQALDLDDDGSVSPEEREAGRVASCEALVPDLDLRLDDRPATLRLTVAGLSFPLGAGGLSTMRLVCGFETTVDPPIGDEPVQVTFRDDAFAERLGWREIVARGSEVTLSPIEGDLRTESPSARLTVYPETMVAAPLRDVDLAVEAIAGGPTLPPLVIPDADPPGGPSAPAGSLGPGPSPSAAVGPGTTASGPPSPVPSASPTATSPASPTPGVGAVPGGVAAGEVPAILAADLTPVVALLALLTAAALGAGHALTPGHGKTLMAAYLVGTRGTARHALGLGLSVSVSHTAGILVLAGIVVGAADVLPPEVVLRWAPVVAAVSIVAIGGWMLLGELRRRRHRRWNAGDSHGHSHEPAAGGDHHHATGEHRHGRTTHRHAPPAGAAITWRSLFALGLAGGLIPSTSALLILLGSIGAGRPAFGVLLVAAFGLGMAAVMSGIGLGLVIARDRLERVALTGGLARLREAVPLGAAVVVFGFGLVLTAQALGAPPTL